MDMNIRPRRLRGSEILRKMVRETRVDKSSLIYPIFVKEGTESRRKFLPCQDSTVIVWIPCQRLWKSF